jgi:hypothetical protein
MWGSEPAPFTYLGDTQIIPSVGSFALDNGRKPQSLNFEKPMYFNLQTGRSTFHVILRDGNNEAFPIDQEPIICFHVLLPERQ